MKILHIVSGTFDGGAARGAIWLHEGLKKIGVDSKILINCPIREKDPDIQTINHGKKGIIINKLRFYRDQVPLIFYPKKTNFFFSTSLWGHDFTKHPLYDWADIIHLHWINRGFVKIKDLSKVKKPIVWTLRDMWPFTGGCHYSMECNNYTLGCGICYQLGSTKKNDLSFFINKKKQKYFPESMRIVGISEWISNKAKESTVFRDFSVQTIHNNVSCEDFFPIEKSTARTILGLNTDKQLILVGSKDVNDFYKGFGKFIKAIENLDKNRYFLLVFGYLDKGYMDNLGFEFRSFGFLNDLISLRLLYSSADVFVAPSLMDAFGKTLVEAMACGTPVVCFDATGPKDIVTHHVDGYKASPFDEKDLSNGIKWVLENPDLIQLSINARNKVLTKFDSVVIANQYNELYNTLSF